MLIRIQFNNENERRLIYNIPATKEKYYSVNKLSHPLICQRLFQQILKVASEGAFFISVRSLFHMLSPWCEKLCCP